MQTLYGNGRLASRVDAERVVNPARDAERSRLLAQARDDVAEAEGDRLLELFVGARARIAVGAPPAELCGVAKPSPFHVVIADLDHALGPERDEREILARVPPGGLVLAWGALAGFVRGPVPRVVVETGDELLQLGEEPAPFGHRKRADHADRGQLTIVLIEPEQ